MQLLGALNPRANNFDAMRFAMAALVIYSHSWFVLGVGDQEPVSVWSGGATSLGALAVDVFFVISGYLVSMSWERSRSPLQFLRERGARIYPGFIAVTAICALVIAPLVMQPGLPRFEAYNLVKLVKSCITLIQYRAPGAFWSNPVSESMYVSVWTIEYEIRCYLLALLIGLLVGRFVRAKWVLLVLWLIAIGASVRGVARLEAGHIGDMLLLETNNWPRFLSMYFAGAVAYSFREKVPISGWLALPCVLALWAMQWRVGYQVVMPTCGAYLVFWCAFQPWVRLHGFARHGDFSYGIYLYAFPIQQLLEFWLGPRLTAMELFLLAAPPAVLAGAVSWHLVEKHFLGPRVHEPARPVPVAGEVAST